MGRNSKILQLAIRTICTEAEAIKNLERNLTKDFEGAVKTIIESNGKTVITGMGKSGIIGRKISATLSSTGTPSFFLHPAEAIHGDLGMIEAQDVIIAISYSGETDEILECIAFIKQNGNNPIIAITGNPQSTLAKHSNFTLNIHVEKEAGPLHLAPTCSTTATLVMGDALAATLMNQKKFNNFDFAKFHPGGNLGRRLLTTVEQTMSKDNLPTVEEKDDMRKVVTRMTGGRLGLAAVLKKGLITGVITDGDLRRLVERNSDFLDLTATEVMTKNPKTITKDRSMIDAEKMMLKHKITSLLVEDNNKLIGVIQIYNIS